MAAPKTHVKVSGTWKGVNKLHTRVSGVWKEITVAYRRVSSVYKEVHKSAIILTATSNTNQYNLYSSAGSPADAVNVELTINSGVYLYSQSTGTAGLDITGFTAGSTILVTNNGNIVGEGGNGGASGHLNPGTAGGDAMNIGQDVDVDNTNGNIFGGGGGGDSGASTVANCFGAGGAGGNGEGKVINNAAGSGGSGQQCFYTCGESQCSDTGGSGQAGGNWGQSTGGGAGKAIDLNGNAVTWLGGNQASQVKGAVS